jgi:hypothetical protein
MTEIDFRQATAIPGMLACLPAGYTLVSGSSSRRRKQQNQFPAGYRNETKPTNLARRARLDAAG